MTQQVIHCRATLPDGTTFEDAASFGLTIEATGSNVNLSMDLVDEFWDDLFNTVPATGSRSLAQWISPEVSRAAGAVTVASTDVTAHLDGSNAGGPFHTHQITLAAAANPIALPPQLAACVGYRGSYGSDIEHGPSAPLPSSESAIDQGAPATHSGQTRPRARDRGRVFLGPLTATTVQSVNSPGVGTAGKLDPTFRTDMQLWASQTFNEQRSGTAEQFAVVVWSRRGAKVMDVNSSFVDEGFATIRRRIDTTLNRVHAWSIVEGPSWIL